MKCPYPNEKCPSKETHGELKGKCLLRNPFNCSRAEQKRLDRPDREKIAEFLYRTKYASCSWLLAGEVLKEYYRKQALKLLALIPDIEHLKGGEHMSLEKYLENEVDWTDDNGEPTNKVTLQKHELVALIEPLIEEAKKQGIRLAIDNLKMHYCIMDTETRIKEIEGQALKGGKQ